MSPTTTGQPDRRQEPMATMPPVSVEELDDMLSRLRLTAIRDQLDNLLEEAARKELNLREALTWLCAAEIARKDQRRIAMAMSIAKFPFVRTLEGFEYEALPGSWPDPGTCHLPLGRQRRHPAAARSAWSRQNPPGRRPGA